MSHINEALKKAQKERDIRYHPYGSLMGGGRSEGKSGIGKVLRYLLPSLILMSIVLVSFSRLNLPVSGENNTARPEFLVRIKQPSRETDLKTLYDKAGDHFKNGRFQEAKKLYEELIDSDPGYIDALNNLGVIHIRNKDYPTAIRHFEKAIRLKPVYAEPYYNLACLYAIKGDTEQGLVYLKKAISLDNHVRYWALNDTDLVTLQDLPEFKEMTAN